MVRVLFKILSIEFHLRADSELLLMCRALILCKLEIGCTKSSLSPLSFSHILSLLSCSSPLRCQSNKPIHARSEQALRHARRAGAEFAIIVEQRKAITLLPSPSTTDLSVISQRTLPDWKQCTRVELRQVQGFQWVLWTQPISLLVVVDLAGDHCKNFSVGAPKGGSREKSL